MIDRIVLAVFTIFLIPGLLFCWKGIWLYFKFYFLKFPLAYIIHLITLPLAFWFFIHYKASQNDKFNFLQGIFLSFGFLYVIAFSFIYIKGILLECKYSSKEPKNKDTKKQSNDENLFFKYDEKWANYFKEIIDFDEGNTSKFFLDSPQGSGKNYFY